MRRPAGTGPCRIFMMTVPPSRTRAGEVRHGAVGCCASRCIQTGGEHDDIKALARVRKHASYGRLSLSHSIRGDGCRVIAGSRNASVGSTATTRGPVPRTRPIRRPGSRANIQMRWMPPGSMQAPPGGASAAGCLHSA